jgi:hemoglobin-like flavoprotein
MTPSQVQLVQNSFQKVLPISELAAELFYRKLFELDPALRALFKGDMKEQGRKLMTMLAAAVASLNAPDQLLPVAAALAQRHVSYGVQPQHFETVGAALLWTLEQGLGADFKPEVQVAWAETYAFLSNYMIEAGWKNTATA